MYHGFEKGAPICWTLHRFPGYLKRREYLCVARSATLAVSATRSGVKQTCRPAGLPVVP